MALADGQSWVRDQQVPNHRSQALDNRSDQLVIDGGDYHAGIGSLSREAAIAPDNTGYRRAAQFGQFDGANDIGADRRVNAAAADREDQQAVLGFQAGRLQPGREGALPALIVDPRGQLRDIVGGTIGFEAADFAEVVGGMAGMAGAATHPDDEQAPTPVAYLGQSQGHGLNSLAVNSGHGAGGGVEEVVREHGSLSSQEELWREWPVIAAINCDKLSSTWSAPAPEL